MCGIAGMMLRDGRTVNQTILNKMGDALGHRGPDGTGCYVDGTFGVVHKRLSIIDIKRGYQPLQDDDSILVANGEIYNYVELKQEIHDFAWQTDTDCEIILPIFKKEGYQGFNRLRGMFALAVYNKHMHELILTRDHYGIKPLYIAEVEQGLLFASEPRALFATGWLQQELHEENAHQLLAHQFVSGSGCLFKHVRRLYPGEILCAHDGRITKRDCLNRPHSTHHWTSNHADSALDVLDKTLKESVALHLRSDVPYGLFLSSGVDSTAILTLMHQLDAERVCFTANFKTKTTRAKKVHDEVAKAEHIAQNKISKHISLSISSDDFYQNLPKIVESLDDCVADYAVVPTWFLGKLAKEHGIKVILSGEGSDEFFAGYGRYRQGIFKRLFGKKKQFPKNQLHGFNILAKDITGVAQQHNNMHEHDQLSVLQSDQLRDIDGWLSSDLLLKLDRCLMAHGIEGRTPFVDKELSSLAFSMPDNFKIQHRLGKWVLRRWLQQYILGNYAMEKKRGFSVPIGDWMFERRIELAKILSKQEQLASFLKLGAVEHLFLNNILSHPHLCWNILMFIVWHKIHIQGKSADQHDIFSLLAI